MSIEQSPRMQPPGAVHSNGRSQQPGLGPVTQPNRPSADGYTHRTVAAQPPAVVDYRIVDRIREAVNNALDGYQDTNDATLSELDQRQLAQSYIVDQIQMLARERASQGLGPFGQQEEERIREAVFAALFGLGRIEPLLHDPRVEDIIITGTRPVCLLYSDGTQHLAPPVADTNQELLDQLQIIATHHGQNERQVSDATPFLNQRLPDGSRLAAMWTITPEPHVVIRKHRFVDITLDDLVQMGTLSQSMAAFLKASVAAKLNILVVGSPRAGKTTLLRALARSLPATERFASLETEYELLLHELQNEEGGPRWPLLLPCETRPGTGEVMVDGRVVGEISLEHLLPQSLRMSVSRVIVGEARGVEVEAMLMAMLRGYHGSMSTFHANSTTAAFDGLASLLMTTGRPWTRESALHFIASALHLIVYVDWVETETGWHRFVSDIVEVTGPGEGSRPATTQIFGQNPNVGPEDDPRGYPLHKPEATEHDLRKVRFPFEWLDESNGGWATQFPLGRTDAA